MWYFFHMSETQKTKTNQATKKTETKTMTTLTKNHQVLNDHITHKSGEAKTVCVSTCLAYFGVPAGSYKYTDNGFRNRKTRRYFTDNRRGAILRRFGFAVRSRLSSVGGYDTTVGKVRAKIAKLDDPAGTKYLAIVHGARTAHAIVLDRDGSTLIDTAPRKNDRRRVAEIHAVVMQGDLIRHDVEQFEKQDVPTFRA